MNEPGKRGYTGSLIVSALFVIAGVVTLYDTTGYSDVDSMVFPRAVAIMLVICASIAFITTIMKSLTEEGFGQGIWWRRGLLVVTMLLACVVMPRMGFLAGGAIAFAGGLIAAMHDRWTARTAWLYCGTGAVIMTGFYLMFRYLLHVPLP